MRKQVKSAERDKESKPADTALTKIQAARKAFQAYGAAVVAAQEAIADGPVRGLGTTVFQALFGGYGASSPSAYKCCECGFTAAIGYTQVESWHYCPGCGAEVMRFVHDPQREPKPMEDHH